MKTPVSFPVKCVIAVLSGAAYSAAFPPVGWWWMVFPAIAALIWLVRDEKGTRARALGFLHGMAAYGIGLSWLASVFGPLAFVLWMVLAAFPALFAQLQGLAVARGWIGWRLGLFTALNWSAWEFIRAELFPLKFPWMTGGLAMGPNLLLPWIGVYGVGFFVALGVVWLTQVSWKSPVGYAALALSLVRFVSLVGTPVEGSAVKVAAIQKEGASFDSFLSASSNVPADVDHVIWPEYAVMTDLRDTKYDWAAVLKLCRERDMTLTFGTRADIPGGSQWKNIALTVDGSGVKGEHHKNHPVHFFADGTKGKKAESVQTAYGKIGTPICFDCDYEGVIRKMTAAGAELILSPVMDAKKWTARQHEQHAALFRIRACENGRWIVACASSGVTQAIDPHGQVQARLPVMEEGTLIATVGRESKLTFYTRFGWLTPWVILAATTIAWLLLIGGAFTSWLKKRKS